MASLKADIIARPKKSRSYIPKLSLKPASVISERLSSICSRNSSRSDGIISVQISPAGTLTADTLNYVDNPSPANVIRWQVQVGPTANTRRVTVRVISGQGSMSQRELDLTTVIRQW